MKIKYSICTLVTKPEQYNDMKNSFIDAGFTETDCEFLSVNNDKNNKFDAYSGLNHLIEKAQGKYIICCHQDILLLFDKREELEKLIEEIDKLDNNWGVLSNCGGVGVLNYVHSVTHGIDAKVLQTNNFPIQLKSVDEHFIILKKSNKFHFSENLTGFHFYGTDICLQALLHGYKSYGIDFHLRHLSAGNIDKTFFTCKNNLIAEYQTKNMDVGWIQTTCARVYISKNKLKNTFYNLKPISYLVKKYWKLRLGKQKA